MGGGVLSFDLFETSNSGYLLNEVNHTTEFVLAMQTTGIDIAYLIARFLQEKVAM